MKINFDNFNDTPFAIAVSGGADSMALLYMTAQLNPTVLHVNHKLRDAADVEEKYIIELCKKLDIPCVTFSIDNLPKSNLESAARDARYKLMTGWCRDNGVDVLMTAHQADDQIETFLMNLGRGSGVYGLAAMRAETVRDGVRIVRPLLDISRGDLEQYCAGNNIKYFNDEMNGDEKYTRVKIRKNRHLLAEKLGISDKRILLAIKNLDRARAALETINKEQLTINNIFPAEKLFEMPDELQLRFLGEILRRIGGTEYFPRLSDIERLREKLNSDKVTTTLNHCTVRRLGNKILVVRTGESISFRNKK